MFNTELNTDPTNVTDNCWMTFFSFPLFIILLIYTKCGVQVWTVFRITPNACCTRYSNVNCMKAYYFSLAHIFTYKTTLSQHYYRYQWNKTFSTHAHTYTFTKGAKKRNARSLSCSYDKSYSYLLNKMDCLKQTKFILRIWTLLVHDFILRVIIQLNIF